MELLSCAESPISRRRPAALPPLTGVVPDGNRGDLLEEVSNLVESPTVVLGSFDPAFLALPREVRAHSV